MLSRGSEREVRTDNGREGAMLDETALRGFWRHYRSVMTNVSPTSTARPA